MKKTLFLVLLFVFAVNVSSFAQDVVSSIQVEGNKNISTETIFSQIKIKKGQEYNTTVINEDIKRLYQTGYFEDIQVRIDESTEGVEITFVVTEKPAVKDILFENLVHINSRRVIKKIQTQQDGLLDIQDVKEDARTIEDMLRKAGFSQATVDYSLDRDEENNTVVVTFTVSAGDRVRIKKIFVEGNETFPDKRIIKVIKTRPKWWFLRKGYFDKDLMEEDLERVLDFYRKQGFSDVEADYSTERKDNLLYITIFVEEGTRYYVGNIDIMGNDNITLEQIQDVLTLKSGDVYSESDVKENSFNIRQLYVDNGYVFNQVEDTEFLNPDTKDVDISFSIVENNIASVNLVKVQGNTRTRDDVIRREIRLRPGDRFDGQKMRRSRQRLERLDIFEEIRFDSERVDDDRVNLIVDVEEARTGSISFGGGYSSIEEFVGFVEFAQKNFDWTNFPDFIGGGQLLRLSAEMGSVREHFQLSFTNPWIFHKPISFGFDIYKFQRTREEDIGYAFDEDRIGGVIRFGYEFTEYLGGRVGLRYEKVDISDVVDWASDDLKKEEGKKDLVTLESAIIWDSRDNMFAPSRGIYFLTAMDNSAAFLGSDEEFTKIFVDNSYFFPLWYASVLELRGRLGVAMPYGDSDDVPIFERFFAGGAYTIRGYQERKVGPIDARTNDPIGGESMLVFNIEYLYPLVDFLKVAAFFDTGNVWRKVEDMGYDDFKSGIGMGIRVKTPLGPIKLDYGWPLDLEPGEDKKEGRFHFSFSKEF